MMPGKAGCSGCKRSGNCYCFSKLFRCCFVVGKVSFQKSLSFKSPESRIPSGIYSRTACVLLICLSILRSVESKVSATQMSQRVVATQYGKLRGILITPPNRGLPQVEAYLGLEYASLLGGELRFMPPTSPVGKWDTVRTALKFKPVCPQKLPDMNKLQTRVPTLVYEHYKRLLPYLEPQQEECLNLNIYVPVRGKNDSSALPVVLFIHGESYEFGTGNAYDGSILAAFGRLVVVTLNYRLGVLGFLSTGDSHASGNYGLLDQVAALHWIADNIEAFGGDPRQVTLLGSGHGAAMVHLLTVSPVTKGKDLFRRAIIQSGSALSTWAITNDPLTSTKELALKLNCSGHIGQNLLLVQCLKQFSAENLVNVDVRSPKYFSAFAPTVDGRSVLPASVRNLTDTSCHQIFGTIPILLGTIKNEGFGYLTESDVTDGVTSNRMTKFLRTYVQNVYRYHQQKIYDILAHNYHDWDHPTDRIAIRDSLLELVGDGQYAAPIIDLAQGHAQCSDAATYLYSFTRPGAIGGGKSDRNAHGTDLAYVFGAPLADGIDPFASVYSGADKSLSETVLTYWVNFIKTGNPNGHVGHDFGGSPHTVLIRGSGAASGDVGEHKSSPDWPPFDANRQQYLLLGGVPVVQHHFKSHKMALWLELIPKIHKPDTFDPMLHLLDDFRNATTFEDEGTRQINITELQQRQQQQQQGQQQQLSSPGRIILTQPPPPHSTPPTDSTALSQLATRIDYVPRKDASTPKRQPGVKNPRHTVLPSIAVIEPTQLASATFDSQPAQRSEGETERTSTLGVTVAVGCALLALNSVVFAATFCQWHRLGRTIRARQAEMDKEAMMQSGATVDVTSLPLPSDQHIRSTAEEIELRQAVHNNSNQTGYYTKSPRMTSVTRDNNSNAHAHAQAKYKTSMESITSGAGEVGNHQNYSTTIV